MTVSIEVRLLGGRSVQSAEGEIGEVSRQPKLFAFLTYLLVEGAEGDGYVARDELLAVFWPETDIGHARNTLNQYAFRLREALGAEAVSTHGRDRIGIDPDVVQCDVVELLSAIGRGDRDAARALYTGKLAPGLRVLGAPAFERWLEARREDLERGMREAPPPHPPADRAVSGDLVGAGQRWGPGIVVAAAALAAGAWWTMAPRERIPDPLPRVAILPVVDLVGDTSQTHLPNGIHVALIEEAERVDGLVVICRTSVQRYAGSERSMTDMAAALAVDAIVEASLSTGRDSLILDARVLETETGEELWTGRYADHDSTASRLAVGAPRRIAAAVLAVLQPEAAVPTDTSRHFPPADAIEAFLRGSEALRSNRPGSAAAAIEHFERAVTLDSTYAEAWAGLAQIWQYRGSWFGDLSPAEAMPRADDAVERALRADSTLAAAYFVKGLLNHLYHWRWDEAERAYRRALELNPNSIDVRVHYGNFLSAMRRVEEATPLLERATELSPLAPGAWAELAMNYNTLGREAEAREAARRAIELDSTHVGANFVHALQLFGEGHHREAAERMESAGVFGFAARIYAAAGLEEDSRRLLSILENAPNRNHMLIANLYESLGDRETALDWLELGIEERHSHMVFLSLQAHGTTVDGYEPLARGWPVPDLRDEPRYQALLETMEFPEPPPRPGRADSGSAP